MSGPSQIIIVGEDKDHVRSLYRAAVDHLGIPSGRVRPRPLAQGRGDAKKFVLQQVSTEIRLLRRGPPSALLIIVMDGDGGRLAQRMSDIVTWLANDKVAPIGPTERIAVIVPCRNSETWREFARCSTVDEETDYKRRRRSKWCAEDFKLVGAVVGQSECPKANPPSSLEEARTRLRELLAPTDDRQHR